MKPQATTPGGRRRHVPPAPRWAVRAAHAAVLCTLPSGLWRIAMAIGVPVGYSAQTLRAEYGIPGWGTVYVVGLAMVVELLALLTLGLVRPWGQRLPDRVPLLGGREPRPRAVLAAATIGTAGLLLIVAVAVVQLLMGIETDGHLQGKARTVMVLCYLPAFCWPVLLGCVTWSYARRHGLGRQR